MRMVNYNLIHGQVAIQFPLTDVESIVIPLLHFCFDITFIHMLTERALDNLIILQLFNRFAQITG